MQFKEIRLPQSEPFTSFEFSQSGIVDSLSLINLFIGQNNSGKSLFIRNLFMAMNFDYTLFDYNAERIREHFQPEINQFNQMFKEGVSQIHGIPEDFMNRVFPPKEKFLSDSIDYRKELDEVIRKAETASGGINHSGRRSIDTTRLTSEMKAFGNNVNSKLDQLPQTTKSTSLKRFYIPILRGMRPFENNDVYHLRTMNDYFTNRDGDTSSSMLTNDMHVVFTGLSLYSIIMEKLLGEPDEREDVKQYESFLSSHFFQGEPVGLIPKSGSDTVHVKIGNEKQLPLYQLGDGLQNLIIITFNMFMERDPCFFFIEEPDMCMHPGYQRILLDAFRQCDQHQYYITTHSNHFLDMSIESDDVSIFHFHFSTKEHPKIWTSKNIDVILNGINTKNWNIKVVHCHI